MKKLPVLLVALILLVSFSASAIVVRLNSDEEIASKYAFTLDGNRFALPMSVSTLLNDGWEFYNPDARLAGNAYTTERLSKGEASVMVTIMNAADYVRPFKECTLVGIEDQLDGCAGLVTIDGIYCGMNMRDVFAATGLSVEYDENSDTHISLGEENEKYGGVTGSFDIEYKLVDDNAIHLNVFSSFYGENKVRIRADGDDILAESAVVDSLKISYMMPTAEDSALTSSLTDEIPALYGSYGTFPETMLRYNFYGRQYDFPTPLTVMDGELDYSAEDIVAGGSEKTISKSHGLYLYATVANPLDSAIPCGHGYLKYLVVSKPYNESDELVDFELANGLKIGSTADDVLAAYPAFALANDDKYTDEATGIAYRISDGYAGAHYCLTLPDRNGLRYPEINIDTENGLVREINLRVWMWN